MNFNDPLLKMFIPQLEKIVEPAFIEARKELLVKIAGPTPTKFTTEAQALFRFTQEQVDQLWRAAIDAAA